MTIVHCRGLQTNIKMLLVINETSHPLMSWLNARASSNILPILVTDETSHLPMS